MFTPTQIAQARAISLLRLVEPDTTLVRIASTRGGEYAGPCPFCGGMDRFHVQPVVGKWFCRTCTPRGGDAIDYVQRRARVPFQAAVQLLIGAARLPAQPQPLASARPRAAPTWVQIGWQQAAQTLTERAERGLAEARGTAARAYLAGRGLLPASWQAWRLGFRDAWQPTLQGVLPAITLPWSAADGRIQAVQYRFFGPAVAQRDRFSQKAGGQRVLFGLPQQPARATLIITEGELNAVSCWQAANTWANVLSIGSQEGARQAIVRTALAQAALPYQQVIVWLDERERALALVEQLAPFNGYALWSANGLDANDLLQRGVLAARLAHACQGAGWELPQ